jgi:hypothetical protein
VVILGLVLGCGGATEVEDTEPPPPADSAATDADDTADTGGGGGDSSETGDSGSPATDADGDGAFTPDDCNDADAGVYPGAYDWCDGVDQDCDGALQGEGACGEIGVWSELDVGWWEGTEVAMRFSAGQPVIVDGEVALLGSLNGIHNDMVDTDWNAVIAMAGLPGSDHAWTSSTIGVWAAQEYADHLEGGIGAGDFNGDGDEDIWMVSTGQSGCCDGSAFFVRGPSDRWPKEGAYIRDVADGWWLQAVEDDNFGGDQDAGEDIDGDGLSDAVFLAVGDIWDGTGGSMHVLLGRTDDLPNGGSIADEITLWKSDGVPDDAAYVEIAADMNGDGSLEIAFEGNGDLGVVNGSEVAAADGGILADWATFLQTDQTAGPEFPSPDAVPGDLDGDGLDETILVYQGLANDEGARDGDEACYHFVSGPPALVSGTVADGTVATACVDNPVTGAEYLGADVDFDGLRDLVVAWDTDFTDALGNYTDTDYLTCVLPTSRLALGGRVEVQDVSLCLTGGVGTTADLDDDGLPEFVFAPTEAETTYESAGRIDVLPGFLIPWNDATRW